MATRPRAKARAAKQRARKRATKTARTGGYLPAPKTRRDNYTPELLADLRYRYEKTPESIRSIARTGDIAASTLRDLAWDEGWVKFLPRRGLPAQARPAAMESQRAPHAAQGRPIPSSAGQDYDDMPADLDAFRDALARRIEAILADKPDDGGAAQAAAGPRAPA